ncbi:MAG: hypothetical protein QXH39_04430 [Conexivisphaerales archaeon]
MLVAIELPIIPSPMNPMYAEGFVDRLQGSGIEFLDAPVTRGMLVLGTLTNI